MSEMLPGGGLQQDRFPTVRKGGYDKAHVDDYYVRMDNQFKDLRERLQRMDDELEQYKRDLAIAREKAQVKPEHEQISERMAEILRIAEEEGKERRSKAEAEVKEFEKKAQEEIAKHRKDAEEHSERIVTSARNEANEMVSSAKKEADQLRDHAKKEGERRLSEAEARAKKIHDTADRRLATLTATHAEALRRLKDMHSTLADLVEAEDAAGALETGLSREDAAELVKSAEPKPAEPQQGQAKPAGPQQGRTEPAEPKPHGQTQGRAPEPKQAPRTEPKGPEPKGEEATKKFAPLPQGPDEATVRIKPVPKKDSGQQDVTASAGDTAKSDEEPKAQTAQGPPRGARFTGPTPEEHSRQSVQQDSGDPGITGIYRHPEAGGRQQPPTDDEGVRVIRKQ